MGMWHSAPGAALIGCMAIPLSLLLVGLYLWWVERQ